jgi:hypothetical protein
MLCQVVEEEFPLRHLPETRHFVIVKANHEGSDEIEFLSKVGERTESLDSLDYAVNTQESRNFPEHRHAIDIKAKSGMTEQLRNVEEVSCAAAKIKNALGARQIELERANPADVNSDPALKIEIFRPVRAGICDSISLTNLIETSSIDCFDDPFCIKREAVGSQQSERMLSRAGQAPAIYQLSDFVAKSHLKIDHSL